MAYSIRMERMKKASFDSFDRGSMSLMNRMNRCPSCVRKKDATVITKRLKATRKTFPRSSFEVPVIKFARTPVALTRKSFHTGNLDPRGLNREVPVMSDCITVNASGLSCPQPVMETKKALAGLSSGRVEVLVDTATSRDNVARFAENKGWRATKEERDGEFRVILER